MNRASSSTGWARDPVMKAPELNPRLASSYELGWTWNPITGCLNHNNGLCRGGGFPCYAYKLAHGRLKARYLANHNTRPSEWLSEDIPKNATPTDPFYPRFWEERLNEMVKRNDRLHYDGDKRMYPVEPQGIFVCDMGDLFGKGIPEKWTERVLDEIWGNKGYDRFYLLTKQPQNLVKWSPFPDNCWVGVTATTFPAMIEATKWLAGVKAKVKYLSLEPLLDWDLYGVKTLPGRLWKHAGIAWLIIGACTGTAKDIDLLCDRQPDLDVKLQTVGNKFVALPKLQWVQEIVEAADKASIPVFLKTNLLPLFSEGEIRQEMPGGVHAD